MLCSRMLVPLLWLPVSAMAQTSDAPSDALVKSLEKAVVRALDYGQGDKVSLADARDDFTASGWSDFIDGLKGWLDEEGAPIYSSKFTPSGPAVDIRYVNGAVRLTLPGLLVQQARNTHGGVSTTSYRVEIDIEASVNPIKIKRLSQRTCGGASAAASCR